MAKATVETEMQKAGKQLDAFEANVKDLTLDRMNMAPKEDIEPQTKLSQKDIEKSKDIYLKPARSIGSKEKFDENYRKEYEFAKEYVYFIAEHKEIIGETIDMWTKPFAGLPAEYWNVPSNKPIWGPRYLAEQIKKCTYHRLVMQQSVTDNSGMGQFYGSLAADTIVNRLDARPVSQRKSVFMGANNF